MAITLDQREIQLRTLIGTIHDASDRGILALDVHGRLTVKFSYTYHLLPNVFYPVLTAESEIKSNHAVRDKVRALFGHRVVNRIWGEYNVHEPLTVRSVKELLFDQAFVRRDDLTWVFTKGKHEDRVFASTGRSFNVVSDIGELEELEWEELMQLNDPLTRDELFCFGVSRFPPHSSGYGATHEGRIKFVSAAKMVAERKLDIALPEGKETPVGINDYYDTFLKRLIGRDTPDRTLYKLPIRSEKSPFTIYQLVDSSTEGGMKIKYLRPVRSESSSPPVVVCLPTQIDVTSFRQNLYKHIGARAVFEVKDRFVEACRRHGISEENKALFIGYSLGGIQAIMMGHIFPQLVKDWVITANPCIHQVWQERMLESTMTFLRSKGLVRHMDVIHIAGDGITNYGGDHPFSGVKKFDRDHYPLRVRHIFVTPLGEGRVDREVVSYRYTGNWFDVLLHMIRSFYGPHPFAPFIWEKYRIEVTSNLTFEGAIRLGEIGRRTSLLWEATFRRPLASFLDWVQNIADNTDALFEGIFPPIPGSPPLRYTLSGPPPQSLLGRAVILS